MSFDSLPEEVLAKIVKLSAAAAYFEREFNLVGTPQLPSLSFEDAGLIPLASVNSCMKRICIPTLFSTVVLASSSDNPSGCPSYSEPLDLLHRILVRRPDIAVLVLSVKTFRRGGRFPRFDSLSTVAERERIKNIIRMLPHVSEIPPVDRPDDVFLRCANEHPSLQYVDVRWDVLLTDGLSVNAGDLRIVRVLKYWPGHDPHIRQLELNAGVNIQTLVVWSSVNLRKLIADFPSLRVRRLLLLGVHAECSTDLASWLSFALQKNWTSVSRIRFSAEARELNPPFLSSLIASGRAAGHAPGGIESYTIERYDVGDPPRTTVLPSPGFWAKWRVVSLNIMGWALSPTLFSALGQSVPFLERLEVAEPDLQWLDPVCPAFFRCWITFLTLAWFLFAESPSVLTSLRSFRLSHKRSPVDDDTEGMESVDYQEQLRPYLEDLAIAIKGSMEAMERVEVLVLARTSDGLIGEMECNVKMRRLPLSEGGQVETRITFVRL